MVTSIAATLPSASGAAHFAHFGPALSRANGTRLAWPQDKHVNLAISVISNAPSLSMHTPIAADAPSASARQFCFLEIDIADRMAAGLIMINQYSVHLPEL